MIPKESRLLSIVVNCFRELIQEQLELYSLPNLILNSMISPSKIKKNKVFRSLNHIASLGSCLNK